MLRRTWEGAADGFMLLLGGEGLFWVTTCEYKASVIPRYRVRWFFSCLISFRDPLTLHHGRWNLRSNEYTHAEWPVMEEHVGAVLLCVLGRSAKLKGYEWDGTPALQLTATLTLGKVSFEFYFHIYKIERWAADLRASLQVPCSWATPLWLRQPCRGNNGPNRLENAADRFLRGSRFLQKAQ